MTKRHTAPLAAAIALSLGLALSGCGDLPNNRSLNSVKQPLVEHRNFTLDLATSGDTLSIPEQRRLADWFETMNLRYGDRIALDGQAGAGVRNAVGAIAGRSGMLLSDGAPVTEGFVQPGTVRVVVTRSRAFVEGCPDWSDRFSVNLDNHTSDGFGCAVNGNLAAMIADPEHLLHGAALSGGSVVTSSTKAIDAYREKAPSGKEGLPAVSTQNGGK